MDLLNWSTALDFESYQMSWQGIATSSRSEAAVPIGSAEWELAVAAENGLLDSMGNIILNSAVFETVEAELSRRPFITETSRDSSMHR